MTTFITLLLILLLVLLVATAIHMLIKIIDNYGPACGSAAAVGFIFLCVMFGLMMVKWRYF